MNFKNPNLKCRISWFYGQWQQCYSNMQKKLGKGIRFVQGLPEYNDDLGDIDIRFNHILVLDCLLYTSPSPRDYAASRMPSSA